MDITILNLYDYRLRYKELASREQVVNGTSMARCLTQTYVYSQMNIAVRGEWSSPIGQSNVSLLLVHNSFHPAFFSFYFSTDVKPSVS